jgi:hypothetical protein
MSFNEQQDMLVNTVKETLERQKTKQKYLTMIIRDPYFKLSSIRDNPTRISESKAGDSPRVRFSIN